MKKRKDFDGKDDTLGVKECYLHKGEWKLLRKDGFMQSQTKLTACDYHSLLDMVVVGFSNGWFIRKRYACCLLISLILHLCAAIGQHFHRSSSRESSLVGQI